VAKKNSMYVEIKDGNPSNKSTRQKKARQDITQRKRTKANNKRKRRKRKLYANMTQGYEMMINDKKEDLR
jgi:hypothetical protein